MARRTKKGSPTPTAVKLEPGTIVLKLRAAEPKRTKQIQIRLDDDNMAFLRKIAKAQTKGHTTLAREVVEAYIAAMRELENEQDED